MDEQGPASGLSRIGFPDWRGAFARFSHLPNVATFISQVQAFGQLMATAARAGLDETHVDRMFGALVQDLSEYAVAVHGQASATPEQQVCALALIRRAAADPAAVVRLHAELVAYAG